MNKILQHLVLLVRKRILIYFDLLFYYQIWLLIQFKFIMKLIFQKLLLLEVCSKLFKFDQLINLMLVCHNIINTNANRNERCQPRKFISKPRITNGRSVPTSNVLTQLQINQCTTVQFTSMLPRNYAYYAYAYFYAPAVQSNVALKLLFSPYFLVSSNA